MILALLVASTVSLPCSAEAQTTLVHCGTLLAQPGQPARGRATLVITGEYIVDVLDGFIEAAPGGPYSEASTVDLRALFVMPGLIDCHTHVTGEYSRDVRLRRLEESDADQAVAGTVFCRRTLAAGFTTIRNVGSSGEAIFALRDAIAAGSIPGPRILAAGEAISPSGGHGDATHGFREDLFEMPDAMSGIADGVAECRKAVRLQVKRGADVIKLTATGGVLSATNAGTDQQFFEDELEAIIDTAHALGRRVAAHAHGADGIKAAIRAGVDSIEHGSFVDDEGIALFLEYGAYLVPTLMAGESVMEWAEDPDYLPAPVRAKAKAVGPVMRGSLGRAYRAGVKIAFGTDCGVSPHGLNGREFELMVAAGMSEADALVSATRTAAELCGLEREVGALEAGRIADLIGLRGNPLQDIHAMTQVSFVMARGKVFSTD